MKILRSWPAGSIPAQPHIVDHFERFIIANYDYRGLETYEDDILLLEWDMAIAKEELELFTKHTRLYPHAVRVAPYRLYQERKHPVWAHRLVYSTQDIFVSMSESTCDLFGFGCIYLPQKLIVAFLEADPKERARDPRYHGPDYKDERMTDQTFSTWHHWHYNGPPVPIDWDIRPVHLNWDGHQ